MNSEALHTGIVRPGVRNSRICGVPSERLNGVPRLPRVTPWAGMRRPVGALVEMSPFWHEMSKAQRRSFKTPHSERRIGIDW
jgi:hypothetical protein